MLWVLYYGVMSLFEVYIKKKEKNPPTLQVSLKVVTHLSRQLLTLSEGFFFFFLPKINLQEFSQPRHLGGRSYKNVVPCCRPRGPRPSLPHQWGCSPADSEPAVHHGKAPLTSGFGLACFFLFPLAKRSFLFLFKNVPVSNLHYFFFRRLISALFSPSVVSSRISHSRQIFKGL